MTHACARAHTHTYIYIFIHSYIHTFHGSVCQRQQDVEQVITHKYTHLQCKILQTFYKSSITDHLYI